MLTPHPLLATVYASNGVSKSLSLSLLLIFSLYFMNFEVDFILLAIPVGDVIWFCPCSFFFFLFFFPPLLSGPYLWNRYSQRLQIECAAWSCCLILHYSLPSNSLRYLFIFFFLISFFPPRFCPGHISGTVTRRDSKLSVLLGPVV